jgi:ABC-type uncharacterized transport system permease subunit
MSLSSYLGSSCGPILSFVLGSMGLARISLLFSSSVVPFLLLSTFGSSGGWLVVEAVLMVFCVGVPTSVHSVLLVGGLAANAFQEVLPP